MATVRRYTAADQARQRDLNRKADDHRNNIVKDLKMQYQLDARAEMEERADDKRTIRLNITQQREREMEENMAKARRQKEIYEEQQEQEERLAEEMSRLKTDQERDEKMRQQIRETSAELREFEAMLKTAYANKERQAQIAEREAHKYDEIAREVEAKRVMDAELAVAHEAERRKTQERFELGLQYQRELDNQLAEQEYRKQMEYETHLKDKLLVDEIVRKIYEEDEALVAQEKAKKEMLRQYMEEDERSRLEWAAKDRERRMEEEKKVVEYARLQAQRDEERKAVNQAKADSRDKLQRELAEKIEAEKQFQQEMENVRQELYLEEQEERNRQYEVELEMKRIKTREELQRVAAEMKYYKEVKQEQERLEDERIIKEMMAKLANDDRLDQMKAEKRRVKEQEHKRAVMKLIEERRDQNARQREAEMARLQEQERMAAFQKQIIEEERERLLRAHAPKLLGYLPKGVIRGQKDLDILGPDYKEAYSKRPGDPYYESRAVGAVNHPK